MQQQLRLVNFKYSFKVFWRDKLNQVEEQQVTFKLKKSQLCKMFYSQDILQKRGGKFGKIWLAATGISKLTRREIASICVEKSCDDVLMYVEKRMVPHRPGGSRPKFSLYLSALLMYGLVKIHQKNSEYLLADATSIFLRVNMMRLQETDIDLKDQPRADQVTNPEMLDMTDSGQLHPDLDQLLVIESHLPDNHEFWQVNGNGSSVESRSRSNVSNLESPRSHKSARLDPGSPHTVASMDQITLKDPPPVIVDTPLSPIPVPKDLELPMMNGQDLELLMADEPRLSFVDLMPPTADQLPTSTPLTTDRDRTTRRTRRSQVQSHLETPTQVRQEEREKTPDRQPLVEVPEPRIVAPSPGVTQLITSPLPTRHRGPRQSLELELTAMTPSPTRRLRRKRQLAFADGETQIPKTQMKKNLTTGQETCRQFILHDTHGMPANDYFNIPGRKECRKEPLQTLWTRNARYRAGIPESQLAKALSPVLELQLEADLVLEQQQQLEQPQGPQELGVLRGLEEPVAPVIPRVPDLDVTPAVDLAGISLVLPPTEERAKRRKRPASLEESIDELRRITSMTEMPSVELIRDVSTSQLGEPGLNLEDSLVLDDSRQSRKDRSSAKKRKTRSTANSSITEEPGELGSTSSHTLSHLGSSSGPRGLYLLPEEPQVEERFVAVPEIPAETRDPNQVEEDLLRILKEELAHVGTDMTTFRKLCPTVMERKTAALNFSALLDLCANKKVFVKQDTSFGDIYISLI